MTHDARRLMHDTCCHEFLSQAFVYVPIISIQSVHNFHGRAVAKVVYQRTIDILVGSILIRKRIIDCPSGWLSFSGKCYRVSRPALARHVRIMTPLFFVGWFRFRVSESNTCVVGTSADRKLGCILYRDRNMSGWKSSRRFAHAVGLLVLTCLFVSVCFLFFKLSLRMLEMFTKAGKVEPQMLQWSPRAPKVQEEHKKVPQ